MPVVSVLIPAYRPDYLRQAIASVLAQTYGDYELLISDDCPDDGVKLVVREFGDRRIRLLEGPRQGLVANSAQLFEQSRCEFIKFVYDDDFLLPFAIAKLGGLLVTEPKAAFAYTTRHFVTAAGAPMPAPLGLKPGPARRFEAWQVVEGMLSRMVNPIGEPTNAMLRRSMYAGAESLRSYAGFPVRHLIDVAMYLNGLQSGPCIGLGEPHAAFRQHPTQMTSLNNPALSIGAFEWEIFLRGEVQSGRCPTPIALEGVSELDARYGVLEGGYPELSPFRRRLPALRERIERGDAALLDEAFRADLEAGYAAVEQRRLRGWGSTSRPAGAPAAAGPRA